MLKDLALLSALYVAAIPIMAFLIALFLRSRRYKIAIHPALRPTVAQDMPPPLHRFIGRVSPVLVANRFVPVASVHAPRFATFLRWTQVLFIDPQTGDRASILCMHDGPTCRVDFAIATEFSSGQRIVTSSVGTRSPEIDVLAQCQAHRRRVIESGNHQGAPLVPTPGDEMAWLAGRAALVAESLAQKARFRRDLGGNWYVPTLRHGMLIAWRSSKLGRLLRRGRPRESVAALGGFAPLPANVNAASDFRAPGQS